MRQFFPTFSTLPVLGCLRDRRGTILFVTQRLLDAERKRADDVVGRRLVDVWPHGAAWLKLDARALRTRQPVTELEYSNGRWFQSTRIPQSRSRVLWVAEEKTAEVRLRALKSLLAARTLPREVRVDVGRALLAGGTLPGVCGLTLLDAEQTLKEFALIIAAP